MSESTIRLPDTMIEEARRVDLLVLCKPHCGQLRKNSHRDWQGKCPKCKKEYFHVYKTKSGWKFRCYECHKSPGDPIAYVRWRQPGMNFVDAVVELTNGTHPAATASEPERPQQPLSPEWVRLATAMRQKAQNRLLEPEGEPGQEYLLNRGLEPRVWLQFGLGYRPDASIPATNGKEKAPAICMPWYAGGELVGVRYRFLSAQNGNKLASETGSRFAGRLFGSQGLPDWVSLAGSDGRLERLCDLIICEGEINAMSIWQVASNTNLHVLSVGSESAKLSDAMIAFASRYRSVIVWMDKSEAARDLQTMIPRANSITSPGDKDANDLLCEELLGAVLSLARLRACRDEHQREGLLWDLWDAAQSWLGVDAGTIQVMQKLAGDLGKAMGVAA